MNYMYSEFKVKDEKYIVVLPLIEGTKPIVQEMIEVKFKDERIILKDKNQKLESLNPDYIKAYENYMNAGKGLVWKLGE